MIKIKQMLKFFTDLGLYFMVVSLSLEAAVKIMEIALQVG